MGRGIGIGLGLNRGGKAGVAVPTILLSNTSVAENVANGTTIGVLSVINGSGTYTFTETADPDSKFGVTGSNLNKTAALNYGTSTSHSVTIHADNGAGSTLDRTFTINVTNVNEAPVVSIPLVDQSATESAAFSYQFNSGSFTDPDTGTTLTYSASLSPSGSLPAWLSFNPSTRTFSGTPSIGDVGTLSVRVTASDGTLTVFDDFTITVSVESAFSFTPLAYYDESSMSASQWTDLGPNGIHFTQATAGNQPTVESTGLDDTQCLYFDGVDNYMVTSSRDFSALPALCAFARVEVHSSAFGDGLLVLGPVGGNDYDGGGATFIEFASGTALGQTRGGTFHSLTYAPDTPISVGGVLDNSGSEVIYNHTAATSDASAMSNTAFASSGILVLGTRYYSGAIQSGYPEFRIRRLVLTASVPDAGQLTEIWNWLEETPSLLGRAIDGGPDYYDQFSNSFPTDPSFFPLGVWFESVITQGNIDLDKGAGLNLYVVLTEDSDLDLIESNDMYMILQQVDFKADAGAIANVNMVGWELQDEIDMIDANPTGSAIARSNLNTILAGLPSDGRFRWNNYGKGVGFWLDTSDAEQFVNDFQQTSSVDLYWFTDPDLMVPSQGGVFVFDDDTRTLTTAEAQLAANYGKTVDRVRELDALDSIVRPVWNFVEVGWPFTHTALEGGRQIDPAQIEAAVWHSIIAGARGIVYFNHSFGGPNINQHCLRDSFYATQRAAVIHTNTIIASLAAVLNAPFADAYVTVGSSVRATTKYYAGEHYVFAASNQHASSTPTFTLSSGFSGIATVVGESRNVTITSGSFSDTFADGNAWHIYHIREVPLWTPADLGNDLVGWWDATDSSTITQSGGTVSQWNDKSTAPDKIGNAVHTAEGQPAYDASTYGAGREVLDFDGADLLTLPSLTSKGWTAVEVFTVRKLDLDPPLLNIDGPFFSANGNTTANTHDPYSGDSKAYSNMFTTVRKESISVASSWNALRITGIRSAPSDWQYWVDGVSMHSTTTNTFSLPSNPTFGASIMPVFNSHFDGKGGEAIVIKRTLTTLERQKVEGYLARKWGITANLAIGHLHKYDPP